MFNNIIVSLTGYPWDWQSGNAKFPVYNGYPANHHQSLHKQHLQQHRPRYPTVRILNMNTNVSAVAGDTAHLPCRVKDLGEYTVKFVWYILMSIWEKDLIRKSWFLTLGIYFLGFLATRPWYKCFICWSRHIQLRSTFPSNWRNKRSYFFFWLEFRGKKSWWIIDILNDYMKLCRCIFQ